MIVIADSSPLIVLVNIGQIDLLRMLFGQVVVPPQVIAELQQPNRPPDVREFVLSRPSWLIERSPSVLEPISELHAAEAAAICLAQELNADLLLIDETQGRKAAADRHIPFTGTIGLLELAADRGLLDLEDAFNRVKRTDFWISDVLLDERLRVYRQRQTNR